MDKLTKYEQVWLSAWIALTESGCNAKTANFYANDCLVCFKDTFKKKTPR